MTPSLVIVLSVDGYRPKTTGQNLIKRIGEYEAKVTNNIRLHLRYCTVEANYWQTRSIVLFVCDSRATCQSVGEWSPTHPLEDTMVPMAYK